MISGLLISQFRNSLVGRLAQPPGNRVIARWRLTQAPYKNAEQQTDDNVNRGRNCRAPGSGAGNGDMLIEEAL